MSATRDLLAALRTELDVYRRALLDERTPKIAKWMLGGAIAYLLSPIDLVPDFIPILGQLDDAVIVPALVTAAIKMIPDQVLADARRAVATAAAAKASAPAWAGARDRPLRIYFICVGNAGRSQMAEAFARHLGGARVDVRSAGTQPAASVSRGVIAAMKERGIDLGDAKPKSIDLAFAEDADHVITMGCSAEAACPAHIVERIVDWGLEDPAGKSNERIREIRDEIEERVRGLLAREGALV